jgi:hypothetical protein
MRVSKAFTARTLKLEGINARMGHKWQSWSVLMHTWGTSGFLENRSVFHKNRSVFRKPNGF